VTSSLISFPCPLRLPPLFRNGRQSNVSKGTCVGHRKSLPTFLDMPAWAGLLLWGHQRNPIFELFNVRPLGSEPAARTIRSTSIIHLLRECFGLSEARNFVFQYKPRQFVRTLTYIAARNLPGETMKQLPFQWTTSDSKLQELQRLTHSNQIIQ